MANIALRVLRQPDDITNGLRGFARLREAMTELPVRIVRLRESPRAVLASSSITERRRAHGGGAESRRRARVGANVANMGRL